MKPKMWRIRIAFALFMALWLWLAGLTVLAVAQHMWNDVTTVDDDPTLFAPDRPGDGAR